MNDDVLKAQRQHLAELLEAIQRCVYFLNASDRKLAWPLHAVLLEEHKKDVALFETLAAINERFAKLQDTLGAGMRHTVLLSGESCDTFLNVLTFFEKADVVDSVATWQLCRTTRNLAAHDYGTDYAEVAEHFNALHTLIPALYDTASRFVKYCQVTLDIHPAEQDFSEDFAQIVRIANKEKQQP